MPDDHKNQTDMLDRRIALATQSVLSPLSMAADVMTSYSWDKGYVDTATVEEALKGRINAVIHGNDTSPLEELLITQAYSLNSAYQALMLKAASPQVAPYPERVSACLKAAISAHRQCLQAIELLGRLKNPPGSTLIQQQNIAHMQQVNNGSPPPAQATESTSTNELLRDEHAPVDV